MDDLYYQGLYFSQNAPQNAHITNVDVGISFFLAVFLITILTLVLDQWQKEQIKEMEKEFRLLEYQLLKRGIGIKNQNLLSSG